MTNSVHSSLVSLVLKKNILQKKKFEYVFSNTLVKNFVGKT